MNTDIRILTLIEDDLREAARREVEEASVRGHRSDGTDGVPGRGRRWGSVAAVVAGLLVVAGSIGFLAQGGTGPGTSADRALSTAALPTTVPAPDGGGPAKAASGSAHAQEGGAGFSIDHPGLTQGVPGGAGASAPQADLSKIVRDGRIGLLVSEGDFAQGVATLTRVADSAGGTVLASSTQNDRSGTFTLRIPAVHFDQAMLRLRGIAKATRGSILYDDRTGQDVTSQYIDLKARLSILKGQRTLLIGLRDKATSVGAILSLSHQIDDVQLQIEQLQGQLNVLNDQVAESTIRVELRERGMPQAEVRRDQPSLGAAWDQARKGFLRVIGAVIIGLGYLIPVGLLAVGLWGVVTLARRRRPAAS